MGFSHFYTLTIIVVLHNYCTGFGRNKETLTGNGVGLTQNEVKFVTIKDKAVDVKYSYNVTSPWSFVIVQAHSRYQNISLSTHYNREVYTSSNTAIFKSLSYSSSVLERTGLHSLGYALTPVYKKSIFKALVAGVTYTGRSPIPGGCCLTCTLEIDPNLVIISKHYYKSILTFASANVYDYNTVSCSGTPYPHYHKPLHYRLKYSIYQYFLEEGNLSDDELFDGLTKMLTTASVKEHGKKVRTWNPENGHPSLTFDTPRGQGIIFNILVYDPVTDSDAVYSPVVTYGCSFTAKVDGCDSMGAIVNIVVAVCGALLGLCICLFGHRWYHLYIILSISTLFAFFGFIMLTNGTEWDHTVRLVGSLCIGILSSGLVYMFWRVTQYRYIVLYICGLTLGFLVAGILFFSPFGNLRYWKNNVNYWTVMFCTSFTVPFVFLLSLKVFVIVNSAFVGAYGFVVGVDMFLHSSLSYIILDILVRAIEDDFQKYDVPFQRKDYILSAVWAVLTILGAVVQYRVSRGQTTLHPVPPKEGARPRLPDNRNIQTERTTSHVPRLFRPQSNAYQTVNNEYDERLPILIESGPSRSDAAVDPNGDRKTRYGTNIVC